MSWKVRQVKSTGPDGKEVDNINIDCEFPVYCEFCQNMGFAVSMNMFLMKFLKFDLDPEGNNPTSHAIDFELRCPSCGWHETFGVAVSKEEFDAAIRIVQRDSQEVSPS